jgi:hypothetical protein
MKILHYSLAITLMMVQQVGSAWNPVNECSVVINKVADSPVKVQTVQISSLNRKLLVIEFCSGICSGANLHRLQINFTTSTNINGTYLHIKISFDGTLRLMAVTVVSTAALEWTFQKSAILELDMIEIKCNQKTCEDLLPFNNIDKMDRQKK